MTLFYWNELHNIMGIYRHKHSCTLKRTNYFEPRWMFSRARLSGEFIAEWPLGFLRSKSSLKFNIGNPIITLFGLVECGLSTYPFTCTGVHRHQHSGDPGPVHGSPTSCRRMTRNSCIRCPYSIRASFALRFGGFSYWRTSIKSVISSLSYARGLE